MGGWRAWVVTFLSFCSWGEFKLLEEGRGPNQQSSCFLNQTLGPSFLGSSSHGRICSPQVGGLSGSHCKLQVARDPLF
jgi:hypothetical protein